MFEWLNYTENKREDVGNVSPLHNMKRKKTAVLILMIIMSVITACGEKEKESEQDAFQQVQATDQTMPEGESTEKKEHEEKPSKVESVPSMSDQKKAEEKNFSKGYYEVGQENMGYLYLPDTMIVLEAEDTYYHFGDNKKSVEFAYFDYDLSEAYSRYVDGLMNNSQAYYEVGDKDKDYRILMVNNPLNDGAYDMGYVFIIKNPKTKETSIGIIVSVKKDNKEMQEIAGDILASWHGNQMFDLEAPINKSGVSSEEEEKSITETEE